IGEDMEGANLGVAHRRGDRPKLRRDRWHAMRDGGGRSAALQGRAEQQHRDKDGALAEGIRREERVLVLAVEARSERTVSGIEQDGVIDQPDRPEASASSSLRYLSWRDI